MVRVNCGGAERPSSAITPRCGSSLLALTRDRSRVRTVAGVTRRVPGTSDTSRLTYNEKGGRGRAGKLWGPRTSADEELQRRETRKCQADQILSPPCEFVSPTLTAQGTSKMGISRWMKPKAASPIRCACGSGAGRGCMKQASDSSTRRPVLRRHSG